MDAFASSNLMMQLRPGFETRQSKRVLRTSAVRDERRESRRRQQNTSTNQDRNARNVRPPRRQPLVQKREKQQSVAQRQASEPQTDIFLPRSILMDKEIITRTSGKRLGYVDDIFVDPVSLEVTTLYLRQNISPISIASGAREHVSLSSLRQIGDVVLVHDESALWDPPGDETMGFVKMVGSEVETEDGLSLGKVRDFLFNPDNGEIVSIRYDALGLPSIPQNLLGCSRLDWRDIVAVGPSKTIVRRGAERRAVKENEGWITEYVTSFINLIGGLDIESDGLDTKESYRADPAYAAWYERHAKDYEQYYKQKLPEPIVTSSQQQKSVQERQNRSANTPLALPPPQRRSVSQALRSDQPSQINRQPEFQRNAEDNRRGTSQRRVPRQNQPPRRRMKIDSSKQSERIIK
jgi:sporulation protein YlmC with PRC-barrel domain